MCVCGGVPYYSSFRVEKKVKSPICALEIMFRIFIFCRSLDQSDCKPIGGPISPQDYRVTELVEQGRLNHIKHELAISKSFLIHPIKCVY